MILEPGSLSEEAGQDGDLVIDWDKAKAVVYDLRTDAMSGRYALYDCGDGVVNSVAEFAFEECDFGKDPSGPNTVTYPHVYSPPSDQTAFSVTE